MNARRSLVLLSLLAACGNHLTISTVPLAHRPAAAACPSDRPAFNCTPGTVGPRSTCSGDAQCTAGSNGRCAGNQHDSCFCSYDTCTRDGDCPSGQLCDCRGTWRYGANGPNRCLPGNCRVDADCGPGGFCSPSLDATCGAFAGVTGWFCHTASDRCVNDGDCAGIDGGFGAPFCGFHPDAGRWLCSKTQCAG